MAKPGSNGACQIAGGARAVDLRVKAMSDHEAREAQELIEHRMGGRCNGCGRRITVGVKFTSISVRDESPVLRAYACNRPDCDFAETAAEGATVMEMFELAWLDENGKGAPASLAVARRLEAKAAEVDAGQARGS